jgi:hypothetical protein
LLINHVTALADIPFPVVLQLLAGRRSSLMSSKVAVLEHICVLLYRADPAAAVLLLLLLPSAT